MLFILLIKVKVMFYCYFVLLYNVIYITFASSK